jgi:hypothetical protein
VTDHGESAAQERGHNLRPFFSFYGAKWRAFRRYPEPRYGAIVEPFAGSASYATRYPDRAVDLYDADEAVAGVWDYIIHAPEAEVRALPLLFDHVDELSVPQEARWLIGFWLNHGAAAPCKTPSAWMRKGTHDTSFWGPEIRERIASQQASVRHWTITHGQYDKAPNDPASWFIDPPYQTPAGRHYRCSVVDYDRLGEWCQDRIGQVIVCEQEGATWLPFGPAVATKSTLGKSREVVWLGDSEAPASGRKVEGE